MELGVIKTMYERASEWYLAKHGSSHDVLELQDDGTIHAYQIDQDRDAYCSEYITEQDLSDDLDKVREERLKKEEAERVKCEQYKKVQAELNEKREKQNRLQMYNTLKKEFDGGI